MRTLWAPWALTPQGWKKEVAIGVDAQGRIASVAADRPRAGEALAGPVVAGMANVHSHAFQRAMAGLTEARTGSEDSFWTWRDVMYRFAARLTAEGLEAIAAHLYVEMLKAGYTSVAEFHYLHHDAAGAGPDEMAQRIAAAATTAGIALTHLPVLYAYSGFGARPPREEQRRFVLSGAAHAKLVEGLAARHRGARDVRVGLALHSLRAVDPPLLEAAVAHATRLDARAPIHIHIAEQVGEVDDCLAWSGQRPVAWLLDHAPVDARWCLVHATHLDGGETRRLAASGAVAGLCPTTEANLGDGLFPAGEYLEGERPGAVGIGSDSHVTVGVAEELRVLEYGQRLARRRRAVLASAAQPSPGARLFTAAAEGGARACGLDAGRIAEGARADLVVLDADHPALWNKQPAQLLDAWIFAGDNGCVRDVMVGGDWRIRERRHSDEERLAGRYRAVQAALLR